MQRGEIWWADLPTPVTSEPGYRRPVLIVQSDEFNRSRIPTVIAVVLTTNLRLVEAPGNVLVTTDETGLPQDSVVIPSDYGGQVFFDRAGQSSKRSRDLAC
jgi:mRNA interferase MazF